MRHTKEYELAWWAANRDRILLQKKLKREAKAKARLDADVLTSRKTTWRKHNQKPIAKFRFQKNRAEIRGVEWKMSFDEWMKVWEDSGRWELRGRKTGCYCMCRYGDTGPYSIENIYIGEFVPNAAKRPLTKPVSVLQ